MITVNQIITRVNHHMHPCIDVGFSNGYTCGLLLEPGQTTDEVLKAIDTFRGMIVRTGEEAKQCEYNHELFNEFMKLSRGKKSGVIRLENVRMLEITRLIPDCFHHLPDGLEVGDAVSLREAPY